MYQRLISKGTSWAGTRLILQTENDDKLSLCGKKLSPQIRINKDSETDPIDAMMLKSKIHYQLLNNYYTKFKTVIVFHIRNLASCEF